MKWAAAIDSLSISINSGPTGLLKHELRPSTPPPPPLYGYGETPRGVNTQNDISIISSLSHLYLYPNLEFKVKYLGVHTSTFPSLPNCYLAYRSSSINLSDSNKDLSQIKRTLLPLLPSSWR